MLGWLRAYPRDLIPFIANTITSTRLAQTFSQHWYAPGNRQECCAQQVFIT
jgi:hypothetical protein